MAHRKDSPVLEAWHNYIWPSLAFIVVLLVLPFLAPFLLIMWTYRKWLTNQLAHRRPDIEIMKETDAIWFQNAETNMAIINSLWFLKGTVNPTTLVSWQRHLDSRIASAKDSNGNYIYPKMRCTMKSVWHRYVWFPIKDFDIADYVTQCEETPRNLTELETLLGRLSSAPFPDDKAQWKMEIIPFHNGEYICILRVHHAIGDGGALVKMTMASMVDEEVPLTRAPPKLFGTKTKLKKILQAVFTTPMMLINLLLKTFDLNALHGPKLCGDKLVAWSHNLDLDFIKKMKTAGNCTVNDVLMSCLAMAFQAYFRRNCSVCPKGIRCSVPVDMRAHKPGDRTLDNQFALVFLELPLNENGPMETLKETKRRMDVIKQSAEPVINSWSMYYLMARLPSYFSKILFDMITDKCSMVVSNVPGPTQKFSMNGDVVEGAVFWPPQRSKVGLGVSLLSFCGKVNMGVIVDKMLLSNPRALVDLYEENIAILAQELGVSADDAQSDCQKGILLQATRASGC